MVDVIEHMHKGLKDMMEKQLSVIVQKLDIQGRDIKELREGMKYQDEEVQHLKEENSRLRGDCSMLQGRMTRMEKEMKLLQATTTELQCRSMRDNLVFWKIPEKEDEWPDHTENILREQLVSELGMKKDEVEKLGIDRCHRMGRKGKRPRPIVAKFNPYQHKMRILEAAKKSGRESRISVSEQFPPQVIEERRKLYPVVKEKREKGHKARLAVNKLIVDGKEYQPPQTTDINLDAMEEARKITPKKTARYTENGSTFQGHATKISSFDQVKPALYNIYKDSATAGATHNIWAARLKNGMEYVEQQEDDGEYGAASRVLQAMRNRNIHGAFVAVTRWHRGGPLSPRRLDLIQETADKAITLIPDT